MLVVMERALAMAVVMQVLGEPVDEMPQDRPLSVIEHSLCEMWFSQFATSMGDSWPQKDPLIFKLGDLDLRPHRSRLHEPKESMLFATIELETGGQQRELFCLLPLSDIESLLHTTGSHGLPLSKSSEIAMQQRAHDLPVAVTVALGSAYLRVSELANLVEGDVIVLDQRISEPLPLKVAEKTKFFGWLGRKGNRQAFKVSEVA